MAHDQHPGPSNGPWGLLGIDEGTLPRADTPSPGPIGLDAKGAGKNAPQPSLAERIVAYARARLGQVHGNGECFTLADDALKAAGARSAADFGQVAPDVDYVWGTPVNRVDLRAGDVIQLRDYRVDIEMTAPQPDGSTEIVDAFEERPHHTALVESVGTDGRVRVLEQNHPVGTAVTRNVLHLSSTTYNSGTTTHRVTVQGTFWFYRAQAR